MYIGNGFTVISWSQRNFETIEKQQIIVYSTAELRGTLS